MLPFGKIELIHFREKTVHTLLSEGLLVFWRERSIK